MILLTTMMLSKEEANEVRQGTFLSSTRIDCLLGFAELIHERLQALIGLPPELFAAAQDTLGQCGSGNPVNYRQILPCELPVSCS